MLSFYSIHVIEFDKFLSLLSREDWEKMDLGSECFIINNNNYNELFH